MIVQANTTQELIDNSNHIKLMNDLDEFITSNFNSIERYFFKSKTINLIGYQPLDIFDINKENNQYWPLISLAPQKNNVSLYIVGQKNGMSILENYKEYFTKSMMGKSCLRIKNIDKIDLSILKKIIQDSIDWYESNKTTK